MSATENCYPINVDQAVERLHSDILLNDEILLVSMTEENLTEFHFSLGNHIRNEYGLWKGNEALLESCRMSAGKRDLHVDNASLVILKALWMRLQKEDRLNIVESMEL